MSTYGSIMIVGILATSIMTLFLYLVRALKIADTDMLSAIGTLVTRNTEHNSRAIGLIIHAIAGIIFAFVYLIAAASLGFEPGRDFIYFGTIIGFAHGVIFSMVMTILVAEHHPIERFREKGFSVVAAHAIAHIIYGFSIGAIATLMDLHLDTLKFFGGGAS